MSGHGASHSHSDNPEHKRVGIFISVLAVVMAVVSALTNQQANQMIVKEVKSSNGFSWYQAKRQRSYLNELEIKRIDFLLAGDNLAPAQKAQIEKTKADLEKKNAEYKKENAEIEAGAKADGHAAEVAAHKHHLFEFSEISLHIAVVLCSLVLLTNQKLFFRIGIVATIAGVIIAMAAQFSGHHQPGDHQEEAKPAAAEASHLPAKH